LRGPGDGVSDSIPATIGGKQPARLADGEFVIPARIVSEIGNGSTEAGAKKLYAMMDRIQGARKKSIKNVAANTDRTRVETQLSKYQVPAARNASEFDNSKAGTVKTWTDKISDSIGKIFSAFGSGTNSALNLKKARYY